MAISVFFALAFFAFCDAAPSANTCEQQLQEAGASSGFHDSVAHGIHAMTVDDLKKFDPTVTENNYVPTIDLDLRSELAILPYAPIRKTNDSESFLTEAVKTIDLVLTHMNEKHWEITGFNPLERVVHAFHMQEVWAHTKVLYDKIGKTIHAPSAGACQCALDVENNGIMKMLRFIAMAIREPSLVYGNPAFSKRMAEDKKQVYAYKPTQTKSDKNTPMESVLLETAESAMPPLKDQAAWEYWKLKVMKPTTEHHHDDLAIFLHCALAKARAEEK